jgi:LysR family nitrogen assimilation transcriptional regulator
MTPRQLKYFIEIARQLSFTKASAILHVTQPALSRQMQELESALGVKLFTRSDLGVGLTAAGRHLSERAPGLLEAFRQVSLDVAALADAPAGRLRIGVPPSLCDLVTTPSAHQYALEHPNVSLSITEASSAELTEHIAAGALDFAIVAASDSTARFRRIPLLREPMVLASPPQTVSGPDPVDASFLAPLQLVASRQPNALRRILDDAMAEIGVKPHIVLEASSVRLLTQITHQGTGRCVLPYSAVARMVSEGRLEARRIARMAVTWELLHVRNVEPTPSIVALVNILIAIAREAHATDRWPGMELLTQGLASPRR